MLHGSDWEQSRSHGQRNIHNYFNDCATSELRMQVWNWNVTDSKKIFSTWLLADILQYDKSIEMSHDFVHGQSVT